MRNQSSTNWLIPLSIIVAGVLIAGSLLIIKLKQGPQNTSLAGVAGEHLEENMLPVTATDHILGNPNAPVIFVEYSDTDCPFCQQFQQSLHKIVNEYGKTGKVAWVYRHFAFHPNAPKEAEATECVAELGGNDKFWQYVDLLFSKKDFTQTPYKGLDAGQLPDLAASIGINKFSFNDCLSSGKYKQKIADDYQNAIKAGAEGTPYTIIVTRNGKIPITTGAVPYDSLKTAVQSLLNEKPL